MYYSNPPVNYMVTVFIRLVIAVVYTLYLLSCSKCFVCLCLFQYRHCFLVGWCTNKSYVIATSDLWLFIHASKPASLNSPSPLPYNKKLNSSTKGEVCFAYQATGWSAEMAQSGWWRSWPPIHPLLSCLAILHTSNEQVTLLRSTHLHTSHGGPGAVWTGREVELGSQSH